MAPITIRTLSDAEIPDAVDLIAAQEARHYARDPRLTPARPRRQIEAVLARAGSRGERPLVALDARGRVRGYARPSVWQLSENSTLRAFLSARNGVAEDLALPDQDDEDAHAVAEALLAGLNTSWRSNQTIGDLIRWPSTAPRP